ncbi:hypothetical protein K458DRAFT_395497 [Lentithecium fluviatile CBS 122367]|uniref:Uncharacterized protein n=1 Tax=Lentithecium fluviatile CBS 122367 TaxID=1168545 RepID=A0A6G1IIE0_9PLEO|nr:hypothetical protein K458DRAFT_395497 [Lentithecium fluviatile CBS 122367]
MAQPLPDPTDFLSKCISNTSSEVSVLATEAEIKEMKRYAEGLNALPEPKILPMSQTNLQLVPVYKVGTLGDKAVQGLSSYGLLIITEEKPKSLNFETVRLLQDGDNLGSSELISPFCWLDSFTIDNDYLKSEGLALAQYHQLSWVANRVSNKPIRKMKLPTSTRRTAVNLLNMRPSEKKKTEKEDSSVARIETASVTQSTTNRYTKDPANVQPRSADHNFQIPIEARAVFQRSSQTGTNRLDRSSSPVIPEPSPKPRSHGSLDREARLPSVGSATASSELLRSSSVQEQDDESANPGLNANTPETLREQIGNYLLGFLPPLDDVVFEGNNDGTDYLPAIIHVATYEDPDEGTLEIWVYLKPSKDATKEPSFEFTAWRHGSDAESTSEFDSEIPRDDLVLRADFYPPFKSVKWEEQVTALVRYYFLLASESERLEFAEHHIPGNRAFVESLREACRTLAEIPESGRSQSSESQWEEGEVVKCAADGLPKPECRSFKKPRFEDQPATVGRHNIQALPARSFRSSSTHNDNRQQIAISQKVCVAPRPITETRDSNSNSSLGALVPVQPPLLRANHSMILPQCHRLPVDSPAIIVPTRVFANPPAPTELQRFDVEVRQLSDTGTLRRRLGDPC